MKPLKDSIKSALNEAVVFPIDDLWDDIKVLRSSPDTKTKKAIAAKYGIVSNKAAEIEKLIFTKANELRKEKNPKDYTEDDFKIWWSAFNGPTTTVALKKATEGESIEWIKFALDYFNENMFKNQHGDYFERAKRSFNKYMKGCINDDSNSKDANRIALISFLMEQTKEFHDNYILRVKNWASDTFNRNYTMKDWEVKDYMSYLGTESREDIANEIRKTNGQIWRSRRFSPAQMNYFSLSSEEYTPAARTVKLGYNKEIASTVKVQASSPSRVTFEDALADDSFADLPTIEALKVRTAVIMMGEKYKWNEKAYIDDEVDQAERRYKQDMEAVADKVRRMRMDEKAIDVESIDQDPKHFDIWLTDGEKRVHARSIFAAEFSTLVTPHYRFIIT